MGCNIPGPSDEELARRARWQDGKQTVDDCMARIKFLEDSLRNDLIWNEGAKRAVFDLIDGMSILKFISLKVRGGLLGQLHHTRVVGWNRAAYDAC
jgi:hypothetical protein